MKFLFIDDSKPEEENYFITGGVCISGSQIKKLNESLEVIKKDIESIKGNPAFVEIKWSTRKFWDGSSSRKKLSLPEHEKIRNSVLQSINNSDVLLFGGILDTDYYREYNKAHWYFKSIEIICTKFQYYLQEVDDQGLVFADHLSSHKEDKIVREELAKIHITGAQWAKLDRILLNPILYYSHTIPSMCFADFVAGALNFKVSEDKPKYFKIIESNFRKDKKTGTIEGFGISFIPSDKIPSKWHGNYK